MVLMMVERNIFLMDFQSILAHFGTVVRVRSFIIYHFVILLLLLLFLPDVRTLPAETKDERYVLRVSTLHAGHKCRSGHTQVDVLNVLLPPLPISSFDHSFATRPAIDKQHMALLLGSWEIPSHSRPHSTHHGKRMTVESEKKKGK